MSNAYAFIPIAKPLLGANHVRAVERALDSRWVSQGPEVAAFEREFAAYVGTAHACAVSSCTAALHLALRVLALKPGDQVITVSHSFVATVNAIRYCGAIPLFIDIQPESFNLDPSLLEAAILCVHQMGMPCDLERVLQIARRHSLPVVEDAACAIGSEICVGDRWERIGKPHGDIACFSFHPRKLVTTDEGGMLTTNNPEWDQRFRLLRRHCMSIPDTVRHGAKEIIFESYPEFQVSAYRSSRGARTNWQSYCVRLPYGYDQRLVMQSMLDAGIAKRRGVMCSHRESAYPRGCWSCGGGAERCDCMPGRCRLLMHSEEAQDRTFILPRFPQMTFEKQDRVVAALRNALAG